MSQSRLLCGVVIACLSLVMGQGRLLGGECEGCKSSNCCLQKFGKTGAPDSLCPTDVPCRGQNDVILYLRLPAIDQSSSDGLSAEGNYAFMSLMHSAMAKGMENFAVRTFNSTRACPDSKPCETCQSECGGACKQPPIVGGDKSILPDSAEKKGEPAEKKAAEKKAEAAEHKAAEAKTSESGAE